MTERVLTLRELNRATLARQLLLQRRRLSVPKAIKFEPVPRRVRRELDAAARALGAFLA